jgi:uncharacterized protein
VRPVDRIIGAGWSFPPAFDRDAGEVALTAGLEDIHRSLEIIFTTALGERVMAPSFGSALDDMAFEAMNTSRLAYLEKLIKTAILYHEPRIDPSAILVQADPLEGALRIEVEFTVRTTNSRYNFVYPFYLEQGAVALPPGPTSP